MTRLKSQATLPAVDFSLAQQCAHDLIAEYGLTGQGWSFAFNRRKRSLGICNYTAKRIELSTAFVEGNDVAAVRDTILHEIAHALAGQEAGHGPAWVAICRSLGAVPKRTCSIAVMPLGNFRARCKSCGKTHDRYRRPMRGQTYYCRSCGLERGKLRFVRQGGDRERVTPKSAIKNHDAVQF